MSALVILLLAALWAAILLPGALRARREHHPVATVDGFARTMTTLARPSRRRTGSGRAVPVPALRDVARVTRVHALRGPPATPAARRRRAILVGLVAALASTTLLGWVAGGPAWTPAVVSGGALAAYVVLLAAFHARRAGVGPHRPRTVPTAAASAARAAAVGAAVARAPAGPADLTDAPAAHAPAAHAAAAHPPAAQGPVGAVPLDGHGSSTPRITDVPGNAGVVSVRTVPRAGG